VTALPRKWLKPIKPTHHGCLNCGHTAEVLPLSTVLYYGFGGWTITRDGKHYWPRIYKNGDLRRAAPDANGLRQLAVGDKRLHAIERYAAAHPGDWRAIFDSPLRDAEYQRQGKGRWVLVKNGMGFA
jgi:hypothetical protein